MREKIGYYGCARLFAIISCYFRQFLKQCMGASYIMLGVLVFAPMYRWDEWKVYSQKKENCFQHRFGIIN